MRKFRNAPKRNINLSLNSAVLDQAREMGLNISQLVDQLLAAEVEKQYWARWNEDNKQAIADYNARIESEGLFSDHWRTFARDDDQQSAA
jgi:antitoxin CcdA